VDDWDGSEESEGDDNEGSEKVDDGDGMLETKVLKREIVAVEDW